MKKIIYVIILFFLFINVSAFNVDVNKIKIGTKSNELVNNLDKSYKIDIDGFSKDEIVVDTKIDERVKELVSLTLSDKDINTKKKEFTNYQYYSGTSGGETLASSILIETYLKKIDSLKLEASYIQEIRSVSFNQDDVLSFVYLSDAKIDGNNEKVIFVYWFKKVKDEYRIYYPWLTIGHEIDEYISKIETNEDKGEILNESFKELSLNNGVHEINNDDVMSIYQSNCNSVVQITGMKDSGEAMYGSGFFIREGVIVTTWSKFMQFLTNSNYIFVNDVSGHTYQVVGVVAAEVDYDVVVLKINENVGRSVSFMDSSKLNTDDALYIINSKNNNGFSINSGKFISETNGKLKNMFVLSSGDVGAALFNKNGKVVGIATGEKINSELSYANSTNYIMRLQMILNSQAFDRITITSLETFKQVYYTKLQDEHTYNKVNSNVFSKYQKIGNLNDNIHLPLVKANYVDKILSLRYKCNSNNLIDSIFLTASYTEQLVLDGYKLTYEDDYKRIYQNNKNKVIIKSNLQYLIILIMEN